MLACMPEVMRNDFLIRAEPRLFFSTNILSALVGFSLPNETTGVRSGLLCAG